MEDPGALAAEYAHAVDSAGPPIRRRPLTLLRAGDGRVASHSRFHLRAAQGWQFSPFPQNGRFDRAGVLHGTGVHMILRKAEVSLQDRGAGATVADDDLRASAVARCSHTPLTPLAPQRELALDLIHGLRPPPPRKWRVVPLAPCASPNQRRSSQLAAERKVAAATQNPCSVRSCVLPSRCVSPAHKAMHAMRARPSRRLPPIRLIGELMYGGRRRGGTDFAVARASTRRSRPPTSASRAPIPDSERCMRASGKDRT